MITRNQLIINDLLSSAQFEKVPIFVLIVN